MLPISTVSASDEVAVKALTAGAMGLGFALQLMVVGGIWYLLKFLYKKIFKSNQNREN